MAVVDDLRCVAARSGVVPAERFAIPALSQDRQVIQASGNAEVKLREVRQARPLPVGEALSQIDERPFPHLKNPSLAVPANRAPIPLALAPPPGKQSVRVDGVRVALKHVHDGRCFVMPLGRQERQRGCEKVRGHDFTSLANSR